MPLKDSNKRREYHKRYMREVWYPQNRKKHISYVNNLKSKIKTFIKQYKEERSCVDCGYSGSKYPQVLEFDHLENKKFEIGGWAKSALSIRTVKLEIDKCELVCANCHRIRTINRQDKAR